MQWQLTKQNSAKLHLAKQNSAKWHTDIDTQHDGNKDNISV